MPIKKYGPSGLTLAYDVGADLAEALSERERRLSQPPKLTEADLQVLEEHKESLVSGLTFAISRKRGFRGDEAQRAIVYGKALPLSSKDDFIRTGPDALWATEPTGDTGLKIFNKLLQQCADHLDTLSTNEMLERLAAAKTKAEDPDLRAVDNATILGTTIFNELFISRNGDDKPAKVLLVKLSAAEALHPHTQQHKIDVLGLLTITALLLYGAGLQAHIEKQQALLSN